MIGKQNIQMTCNWLKAEEQKKQIHVVLLKINAILDDGNKRIWINPKSLKAVLQKHKIERQAYHGGNFIDNRCRKYFKEHVYKDITDSLLNKIQEFTDDRDIIGVAVSTKDMFDTLNSNFARIHFLISKAQPISEETVLQGETAIAEYINFYGQCFPKQHILEKHSTYFMHRTGFELDFLGEQGGEQLHVCKKCSHQK